MEIQHTNADDVELKATLQQLLLDLRGDAVETDMASGEDCVGGRGSGGHRCCLLWVETVSKLSGDGEEGYGERLARLVALQQLSSSSEREGGCEDDGRSRRRRGRRTSNWCRPPFLGRCAGARREMIVCARS